MRELDLQEAAGHDWPQLQPFNTGTAPRGVICEHRAVGHLVRCEPRAPNEVGLEQLAEGACERRHGPLALNLIAGLSAGVRFGGRHRSLRRIPRALADSVRHNNQVVVVINCAFFEHACTSTR